jgi:hypothetical protein
MPFTQETLNAFHMTGRMAACEVPAQRQGFRAFVAVYPPSAEFSGWTVRRFEIDGDWLSQGYDVSEEEMVAIDIRNVDDLAQVERVLEEWGVSASSFEAPWKSAFPL